MKRSLLLASFALLVPSAALAAEGDPATPTAEPAQPAVGDPATAPDPGATDAPGAPEAVPPVVPVNEVAPPPAPAPTPPPSGSSFMDTRLSFTCTHEDMLRDKGVLPSAPGFHCGRPIPLGVLFFDNYDTRYSGFETMSHLALYKHYDKDHLDVEAGMVIRFNELAEDNIKLSDGGSYVRVAYLFDTARDEHGKRVSRDGVSFVAFPVSSDRLRLGYSYRISWGGSPEFFKPNPDSPGSVGRNNESVPGFKLQLDYGKLYAYMGMKSSLLLDPVDNEKYSVLAVLGGAGVDVTDMIRFEVNGGYFDRGGNWSPDVLGEPVSLFGVSAQLAVHSGMPVGSSVDYALYRNDPDSIARLFKKESYPGGLSWLASAEYTFISQTLKDPEANGSTTSQTGMAGDVNVRVKLNYTRFKLDFMSRDLAYILHSIPSLPTYWDFPKTYNITPEYFVSAGVDQYLPAMGLTLGVTAGIDVPATLESPSGVPGSLSSGTVFVIRNESDRSELPEGKSVAAIFALKGQVKYDFGDSFAAIGELYYQYDPNTVRYSRTGPEDTFKAEFANFNQLGFNVTLQARF